MVTDDRTSAQETDLFASSRPVSVLTRLGTPQGWVDDNHLLVSSGGAVWVVDADTGRAVAAGNLKSIPRNGAPALAGVLPATL